MFTSNISTKITRFFIIGFLLLLLIMSFLSCSQDPILDPRFQDDEDEKGNDDSKEDPGSDTGGVVSLEIPTGGQVVLMG